MTRWYLLECAHYGASTHVHRTGTAIECEVCPQVKLKPVKRRVVKRVVR